MVTVAERLKVNEVNTDLCLQPLRPYTKEVPYEIILCYSFSYRLELPWDSTVSFTCAILQIAVLYMTLLKDSRQFKQNCD